MRATTLSRGSALPGHSRKKDAAEAPNFDRA
jgi:hypothetical protein